MALGAQTTTVLDSAVDKFVRNPSARVVISGHADERGTREYNLALVHLRASAVADYTLAKGIDGLLIRKSLVWQGEAIAQRLKRRGMGKKQKG